MTRASTSKQPTLIFLALVSALALGLLVYPGWGDSESPSGEGKTTSSASVPNPASGHKQGAEPVRESVGAGNTRFRVVDEQGKALPGASVWLAGSTTTSAAEVEDVLLGTTAREGLVVATEILRTDTRTGKSSLIAKHPGFLEYRRSLSSLGLNGDDPQQEVSLVLLRCSEQFFRFVDHQRRPLGGQTVMISQYPIDTSEARSSDLQPERGNAFRTSAVSDSEGIARTQVPIGSFFIRVLADGRYGVQRVSIKDSNKAIRLPREPIDFELAPLYAAGLIITGDVVVAGHCNFKGMSFRNAGQGQLNTTARALAEKWGMTGAGRMLAWAGFSTLHDAAPTAQAVVLLKRAGWQEFKMSMKPAPEAAPLIVDATVLPKADSGVLELKWSHGESLPMHELRTADTKGKTGDPTVQTQITKAAALPLPPGLYHVEGMLGNERYSPTREVAVRAGKVSVVNLDPKGNVGVLKLNLSVPVAVARQNLRFDLYQGNVIVDSRFLPRGKTHILLVESGRYRASLFTTGCAPVTKDISVEGMGAKGASAAVWNAALKLAEHTR